MVLTANENEDYLIKILLRQTRRPEVNKHVTRVMWGGNRTNLNGSGAKGTPPHAVEQPESV